MRSQTSLKTFKPVLPLGIALSVLSFAQGSASAQTQNSSQKAAQSFRPAFSGVVQAGASSNFFPIGSTDHSASLDLTLMPSLRFSPDWNVSAILAGSKELTDLAQWSLDRSDITLGWKGRALNPSIAVAASSALIFPFAQDRFRQESLIAGIRLGGHLGFDPSRFGVSFLTLGYDPSVARFFHEYRTNVSGMPNPEFSISQRLTADFALSKRLSSQVAFVFSNAWTYGGTQSDRFRVDGSIDFALRSNVSLSAGVSTSGTQLKANGVDPNLAVFDPESSVAWASVGVSL